MDGASTLQTAHKAALRSRRLAVIFCASIMVPACRLQRALPSSKRQIRGCHETTITASAGLSRRALVQSAGKCQLRRYQETEKAYEGADRRYRRAGVGHL